MVLIVLLASPYLGIADYRGGYSFMPDSAIDMTGLWNANKVNKQLKKKGW